MNILLVEDHPIFRFGVRQLIAQRWPSATIVEAGTLADALAAVRQTPMDLALLDLNLPDSEGLEAVSQVHRAAPDTKLLVLSLNAEAAYAQRALQLGAAGYLAKDRAADELITALERIAAGGRYITQSLAEQLAELMTGERHAAPHEELSAQEYRVMLQLAQGIRVSEIADTMHLSPKTVSTYRGRILEKLHITSNAELVRYCIARQLIDSQL
ncbi:MAG: response regulator transcription factor [Pseudomonadota bacterium]